MKSETDNDDIDIYGDLTGGEQTNQSGPSSNEQRSTSVDDSLNDEALLFTELSQLQSQVKVLTEVRAELEQENGSLKNSLAVKDKQISVLKHNISSLYKTAKLELDRRTRELTDLRHQYDTLIFRRIANNSQNNTEHFHRTNGSLTGLECNKQESEPQSAHNVVLPTKPDQSDSNISNPNKCNQTTQPRSNTEQLTNYQRNHNTSDNHITKTRHNLDYQQGPKRKYTCPSPLNHEPSKSMRSENRRSDSPSSSSSSKPRDYNDHRKDRSPTRSSQSSHRHRESHQNHYDRHYHRSR